MTDSQLASLSWCQTPIWDLRPDFFFLGGLTVVGLLMWSALSDERKGMSLTLYNVQYSVSTTLCSSQSQTYVMTVGQSASLSWRQACSTD
jgi:hypothetical protein